jgi:hypothetical protein
MRLRLRYNTDLSARDQSLLRVDLIGKLSPHDANCERFFINKVSR